MKKFFAIRHDDGEFADFPLNPRSRAPFYLWTDGEWSRGAGYRTISIPVRECSPKEARDLGAHVCTLLPIIKSESGLWTVWRATGQNRLEVGFVFGTDKLLPKEQWDESPPSWLKNTKPPKLPREPGPTIWERLK